jgi:nitrogen fixation protein FixH
MSEQPVSAEGTQMTTPDQKPIDRKARSRWPYIVVGLLATHVTVMLLAVKIASSGGGHRVLPDYYHKAVNWDDSREELRASARLGWTATVTPAMLAEQNGLRELRFVLQDAQSEPIEGARVVARVWHHAIGKSHEVTASATGAAGVYVAHAPMGQSGAWECELVADRGADHFVHTLTLHIASLLGAGSAGL